MEKAKTIEKVYSGRFIEVDLADLQRALKMMEHALSEAGDQPNVTTIEIADGITLFIKTNRKTIKAANP